MLTARHHHSRHWIAAAAALLAAHGGGVGAAQPRPAESVWASAIEPAVWRSLDDELAPRPNEAHSTEQPAFASAPAADAGIAVAIGAEGTSSSTLSELATDDSAFQRTLGRMAWLAIGLGVAGIVSLWLLRAWFGRSATAARNASTLKLVDTLRLGPRCGIYLVQADSHRVLVGMDQGKALTLQVLPTVFSDTLTAEVDDDEASPTAVESSSSDSFERTAALFGALPSRTFWPLRRST